MRPVLWQLEVSHFNEKVRWALDFKRVAHVRRAPVPGLHLLCALALTRGEQRRLPVLQLDGRTIGDSTRIIAALEERWPEPALLPADANERSRSLELEEHFDEHLGEATRRFVWHHTLTDPELVASVLAPRGGDGRRRAVLRALAPVLGSAIRRDFDADAAGAARAFDAIHAAMDRVEREIGASGYLVGDSFSIADLTAAALFTPLLAPPERPYVPPVVAPALLAAREELAARPGGAWVAEMYARHRGGRAG